MNENENVVVTSEPVVTNKKRKWKVIIGGILVLIAIAVGFFVGYKKLNSNPVSIYKNAINDVYDMLSDALKEGKKNSFSDFDLKTEPMVMNIDAKLDSNIPELKNFTGLNYNINVGLDYAKEKLTVGAGIKDKNPILTALLIYNNKNMYLKSDELFSKLVDLGEYDLFAELKENVTFEQTGLNFSYENMEYILKSMKEIMIDSLDKDKFTMDNETLTINNKEYKAKKVIYDLDKENLERTNEFFADSILKDEKLVKALAELTGMTEEELKSALKENEDVNSSPIKVILYTDGLNNVIAGSVYEDKEQVVKFDNVNDVFNLTMNMDEDVLILKYENDVVTIKAKEGNTELINLKITEKNDDTKIDYEINVEGTKVNGIIETKNLVNKKNKVSADFKFSFNTAVLGKNIDVSLDGKMSVAKEDLNDIDTSNSVKIEELSEAEIMSVYTKLSEVLKRLGLEELMNM